jgi:hypothetical protein
MTFSTGRKRYVLAAAAILAAAMLYGMLRGGVPVEAGYGGGRDTTPPQTTLSGPSSATFTDAGTVGVSVRCNEACRATAHATVSTGGASKVYRSRNATKQLAAGAKAKLAPKFSGKATKAIRRALKSKQLTARVTVVTKDAAGNKTTRKRSVKLKR